MSARYLQNESSYWAEILAVRSNAQYLARGRFSEKNLRSFLSYHGNGISQNALWEHENGSKMGVFSQKWLPRARDMPITCRITCFCELFWISTNLPSFRVVARLILEIMPREQFPIGFNGEKTRFHGNWNLSAGIFLKFGVVTRVEKITPCPKFCFNWSIIFWVIKKW